MGDKAYRDKRKAALEKSRARGADGKGMTDAEKAERRAKRKKAQEKLRATSAKRTKSSRQS